MDFEIINKDLLKFSKNKLLKIEVFAQPIVHLQKNDTKIHFEILSRFYDKNENLIMPEEIFFHNKLNLELDKIDRLIFKKSFIILDSIAKKYGNNFLVAINVSEISVNKKRSFLEYIEKIRKETKFLKPQNIQLEINEKSKRKIFEFVEEALNLGYNISIDDFGTENITIGKLKENILEKILEKDLSRFKIKIDKSFITQLLNENLNSNPINMAFIDLVLAIKSVYPQITLVAEGIEDLELANYLSKKGFDYAQGFFFAKPEKLNIDYIQPNFLLKENL